MFGKHLAVRGALEGLEAGLALDGLGGGVLLCISMRAGVDKEFAMLQSIYWESYGFQLRLGLLRTSIALAVALLLCSTVLSVWPHSSFCKAPYFAPLPMLLVEED